jgi:hypothetical protein
MNSSLISDAIWLHIRAVGQWTTRLYEYFENEHEKLNPLCEPRTRLDTVVSYTTVKTMDPLQMQRFKGINLFRIKSIITMSCHVVVGGGRDWLIFCESFCEILILPKILLFYSL